MNKVLLIEDEPSSAESLQRMLEVEGYQVEVATTATQGLAAASNGDFQVVVTDWKMPGTEDGMKVIERLHDSKPHLPVILITGQPSSEAAIRAMKLGAYDYISKPPDPGEFLELIQKAVTNSRLMSEPVGLGESEGSTDAIIGSTRVMQNVYKEIGRVAPMPVTVLIRGETGTGKELVARAIWQHSGERAKQPFIEVNCVAIPENLLESELFGHEPGAFTDAKVRRIGRFEQADHGTIFLDEIGDMSLNTQAKLLRVLQNRIIPRVGGKESIPVDVRVLAATHSNLEVAMQEKAFREDLYHRLNDAIITLPPLRERKEDPVGPYPRTDLRDTFIESPKGSSKRRVVGLVNYFIRHDGAELGSPCPELIDRAIDGQEPAEDLKRAGEVFELLEKQPWPGNVRQLRNVVRRALLLARGYPISLEIVEKALTQTTLPRPAADQSITGYVADLLAKAKTGELENVQILLGEAVERELYGQAIRLANGDQSKAGAWLGVSRPTMREKLLKYGLHPSQAQEPA